MAVFFSLAFLLALAGAIREHGAETKHYAKAFENDQREVGVQGGRKGGAGGGNHYVVEAFEENGLMSALKSTPKEEGIRLRLDRKEVQVTFMFVLVCLFFGVLRLCVQDARTDFEQQRERSIMPRPSGATHCGLTQLQPRKQCLLAQQHPWLRCRCLPYTSNGSFGICISSLITGKCMRIS
eukprot:TRINITY_DN96840_c0_g1_i1.p1 TRINITY_DN96840_c0_g1~~TRINITY_DN96840_c0_g1_i1.p1  ORF type:complete len:181 (+),score=16.13 TRINITY_DN96840_c0_g1_i1:62-604(+)